jgi:hypothetical protein
VCEPAVYCNTLAVVCTVPYLRFFFCIFKKDHWFLLVHYLSVYYWSRNNLEGPIFIYLFLNIITVHTFGLLVQNVPSLFYTPHSFYPRSVLLPNPWRARIRPIQTQKLRIYISISKTHQIEMSTTADNNQEVSYTSTFFVLPVPSS